MRTWASAQLAAALAASLAAAATGTREGASDGVYLPAATTQSEADEYTRYELLAPDTASFRISYEVTATTARARFFYNPIRKGSAASEESVYDAMSGAPLHFEVVSGTDARKDPLMPDADADTNYIKVTLARPVPEHGEGRLLILKTYRDEKSYYRDGEAIVFSRPLAGRLVLHFQRSSRYREPAPGRARAARLLGRSSRGGGCAAESPAAHRHAPVSATPSGRSAYTASS